ncbi:MAG: hypothetical protein RIC55_18085 [Pirellulaceae bacterium]
MTWTESEIQSLKAQEAKDLAVDLLHKLQVKDKAPISAGQVQLKELQYTLKVKEAEAEDNRLREAHAERIKQLELEIEQEKRKQVEAAEHADQARREFAELYERVQEAQESLSVQLETAAREHNVKMETLEADYAARKAALEEQVARLGEEKSSLQETISELTELSESAEEVRQLREEVESRKTTLQRELEQLDETFETAEFEKKKKINQIRRDQELAIAELESEHKKHVLQRNTKAADDILHSVGRMAVDKHDWERLQQQIQEKHAVDEAALDAVRKQCEAEFKRAYNITSAEVFDVTELFYRQKSLAQEATTMRGQIEKLEAEIVRMRQHIEQEPQRIARAVEAAKVHIQNNFEQAGKR